MPATQKMKEKIPVKIVSLNARGLNVPECRSQLLHVMHRNKADIVFVQETHFHTDATPKLQNYYYPTVNHATTPTSKSKGVSILIAKRCPFQLIDTLSDKEGQYVFLKGSLMGRKITLDNFYAPNSRQVSFFRNITTSLSAFQEGMLILGGDFNVPLDPLHDTSMGTTSLTFNALKSIRSHLQALLLHNTWRTLNPTGRDFTFFSAPHNKYSRIDYFFLSQSDLPVLDCTSIDPMFLSDHHPISLTLTLPVKRTSSLTDPKIAAEIELRIKQYFAENKSADTSALITWEAHKCVIQGILMAAAANQKREQRKHFSHLTARIHQLEKKHKRSLALTALRPSNWPDLNF